MHRLPMGPDEFRICVAVSWIIGQLGPVDAALCNLTEEELIKLAGPLLGTPWGAN